jgi:hypothetical protein
VVPVFPEMKRQRNGGKNWGTALLDGRQPAASNFGDADPLSHRDEREICFAPETPHGRSGLTAKRYSSFLTRTIG